MPKPQEDDLPQVVEVDQKLSRDEAFAEAGDNGVFVWNEKEYHTMHKEEWSKLSAEEKENHSDACMEAIREGNSSEIVEELSPPLEATGLSGMGALSPTDSNGLIDIPNEITAESGGFLRYSVLRWR